MISAPRICAHLQNAARARIRSVPLPDTTDALAMTSILLQHGFIHNITRGVVAGPSPASWRTAPLTMRRLWVDLKYDETDRPVLERMITVSRPARKLYFNTFELLSLCTGRRAKAVPPLKLGEIGIVYCGKNGWWEIRDAIRQGLEGEVVCKVS